MLTKREGSMRFIGMISVFGLSSFSISWPSSQLQHGYTPQQADTVSGNDILDTKPPLFDSITGLQVPVQFHDVDSLRSEIFSPSGLLRSLDH